MNLRRARGAFPFCLGGALLALFVSATLPIWRAWQFSYTFAGPNPPVVHWPPRGEWATLWMAVATARTDMALDPGYPLYLQLENVAILAAVLVAGGAVALTWWLLCPRWEFRQAKRLPKK